jgi:hypothetical protein
MKTDEITVHFDAEVARAYQSASEEDRRKMGLLVNLQLTEILRSGEPLEKIMDEMSREARQSGLTQETLASILHE